jgi:hypothetical protein
MMLFSSPSVQTGTLSIWAKKVLLSGKVLLWESEGNMPCMVKLIFQIC